MGKKEHIVEKHVTGKGELTGFISITTPSTKFNADGVYQANILLSAEEGEKLAAKIKEVRTKQFKTYGKGSKVVDLTQCIPYGIVNDEGEETPDEQGRYILKTKNCAYIKDGKPTFKVTIFDAKGNKCDVSNIGSGTIAKLSVDLSGYTVAGKTGVSIKLKAVQIIDLVEFGAGNAESFGFSSEDGFEFSEDASTTEEDEVEDGEEEELDY